MSVLSYILIFTFIGSIASLIGGIVLLFREKFAIKISHFLSSFAAGVLLGTAFLDLLPEALEASSEINLFFWTLIGLLGFFLLERFIHWFHHHGAGEHADPNPKNRSLVSLVVIGDSIHNFIDGVVIAATFLVSIPLGIVTSLAVAAHEIPQEIGDFGILLHRGIKRNRVLVINIISAAISLLGAILTYLFKDSVIRILPIFLSLAAGFFIYIASSDLIPEIHNEEKRVVALVETLLLFVGVLVVLVSVSLLE